MKKVTVSICTGTTCFVMGASDLQMLHEQLPDDIKNYLEIQWSHCLDLCKNRNYGSAPYVTVDGEIVGEADLPALLEIVEQKIRS